MPIGEIITAADLKNLQAENEKNFSSRGYIAPTVYKLATTKITNYNFYKSKEDAFNKYLFLSGKGGKNVSPAGAVSFTSAATAQTLGINVDFYGITPIGLMPIPYAILRTLKSYEGIVFRFYKTDGAGAYYAILSNSFGVTATVVDKVQPAKLAALDSFNRQLILLKAKHNALALYLDALSKKNLNPAQQQSFNEGLLLLNNMREQMRTIKGVEFTYGSKGEAGIGIIPILVLIGFIVLSLVVGWSVTEVNKEGEKTARINAAFDVQKWVADQKLKIAAAVKAGTITAAQGQQQINELNNVQASAEGVVKASTAESPTLLGEFKTLALIGLGILLVSKI